MRVGKSFRTVRLVVLFWWVFFRLFLNALLLVCIDGSLGRSVRLCQIFTKKGEFFYKRRENYHLFVFVSTFLPLFVSVCSPNCFSICFTCVYFALCFTRVHISISNGIILSLTLSTLSCSSPAYCPRRAK